MRRIQSCRAGIAPLSSQHGAALPLFVVGLVAILGMAGLALDGGHLMLSKSRLQNAVDAAALSAAKTLDDTDDIVQAETAARGTFSDNADTDGNRELWEAYESGALTVTVEFSSDLNPFTPGTSPAEYARVRAENFSLAIWFSAVVGLTDKRVAASAVAGPSPTINHACNLMPMMVCGDPAAGPPYWGYTPGEPDVLKSSTSDGDWDVGAGNFQLIRLGDGQGGSVVREGMAGNYEGCLVSGETVETEPGNTVGPVAQGLNTRFGVYQGPVSPEDYPPDVVVQQPVPALDYDSETDTITQGGETVSSEGDIDFAYPEYSERVEFGPYKYEPMPDGIGAFKRREAAVAIGDCSGTTDGQGEVPTLGFGCFFLLQEAKQKGNESHVYGEFVADCNAGGVPGPDPETGPGPHIIQLYRDFDSPDS